MACSNWRKKPRVWRHPTLNQVHTVKYFIKYLAIVIDTLRYSNVYIVIIIIVIVLIFIDGQKQRQRERERAELQLELAKTLFEEHLFIQSFQGRGGKWRFLSARRLITPSGQYCPWPKTEPTTACATSCRLIYSATPSRSISSLLTTILLLQIIFCIKRGVHALRSFEIKHARLHGFVRAPIRTRKRDDCDRARLTSNDRNVWTPLWI